MVQIDAGKADAMLNAAEASKALHVKLEEMTELAQKAEFRKKSAIHDLKLARFIPSLAFALSISVYVSLC